MTLSLGLPASILVWLRRRYRLLIAVALLWGRCLIASVSALRAAQLSAHGASRRALILTGIGFAGEDIPVEGPKWAAAGRNLGGEVRSLAVGERRRGAAVEDSRRHAAGHLGRTGLERKT